jgi:hypothetical protein
VHLRKFVDGQPAGLGTQIAESASVRFRLLGPPRLPFFCSPNLALAHSFGVVCVPLVALVCSCIAVSPLLLLTP